MRLKKFKSFEPKVRKDILIKQKDKFLPLIKRSSLEPEELSKVHQRDKWTSMSFIEKGYPSEEYLETILQLLKDNGVDTSSIDEYEVNVETTTNEEVGEKSVIIMKYLESFKNFPQKLRKAWNDDTPSEFTLPNYLDEVEESKRKKKEFDKEAQKMEDEEDEESEEV